MAAAENVIVVEALSKSYGGRTVLDDVSLAVTDGEILGLLGPNGAGKSTLLETLVGLRSVTTGSVRVLGVDPARDRDAITSRVAVQPQAASLFETLTVRETLRLYASFHAHPADIADLMTRLGLSEQADVRARDLSGGQMRRLLIGTALVGRPTIVVLDEPSAGLDPQSKRLLFDVIRDVRDRGCTVVLSTHDMAEATELCDRVAILVAGRIHALDRPDALAERHSSESVVSFTVPLGTDLTVVTEAGAADAVSVTETAGSARVSVRTSDPDALMRLLTFSGPTGARRLSVTTGTLEDYFLDLVAEHQPATAATRGAGA